MRQIIFAISVFFALLRAETPDWFSNPKLDSNSLYGFGVGSNIKLAKESAMVDLANSLQSNVKVFFQRENLRDDKTITSSASQTININTKAIDFVNIEPKKLECIQNQCYALIEVDKSKFLKQLRERIEQNNETFNELNSPFDYSYKKDVLYPKIQEDCALYSALGGMDLFVPKGIGEKPTFALKFEYNGDFSSAFKSILEKTIQDDLTKYGKLSASSEWKITVGVFQEDKTVTLDISTTHNDEVIHNASVYDTKKPNMSNSFFAKRLGVQAYKKMQKWGK